MKKMLPCLLLLSLLLCACGAEPAFLPAQNTPAAEAPASSQESTPSLEPTPEPVVIYDAFSQLGTYKDEIGNTWSYVLRIPAIQTSAADATRLNQELYSALYPSVKDALDAMEGGYSLVVYRVDYTVFINGELISIVAEIDTDWDFDSYYAVNFDAGTKTEADRAALLARFDLTEEAFLTRAVQTVDAFFQQSYGDPERDGFWHDRHDRSVARENFTEDCQLYVDDAGQLCMIVRLYSSAGADYYYHCFPVC